MDLSLLTGNYEEGSDGDPGIGMHMPEEMLNSFDLPGKPKYEIKKLNERHRAILRMTLAGMKRKEIAKALGVSEVMISYTQASRLFQAELTVHRATLDAEALDTAAIIQRLQPLAALRLGEVLASESAEDTAILRAATEVLDRGDPRVRKGQVNMNLHQHVTKSDLEEIKRMAAERASSNGQLVDAEVLDE